MAALGNLSPLLFIIFMEEFGLSYERLAVLVVIYFAIQTITLGLGIKVVEKLGYKIPIIFSQAFAALGLILLGILPNVLNNTYMGLAIATVLNAMGCGLIELISSPVTDSLPTPPNQKASAMSFLHSFYCWGVACTIIISTLFLHVAGGDVWWLLPIIWALLPIFNMFLFIRAPFPEQIEIKERTPIKELLSAPLFLLLMIMMICGAASEVIVGQWASLFMEQGVGLSKVIGDIAGPCMFAILMGIGRILYSVFSGKIKYKIYMASSASLCIICYLMMSLSPYPVISLFGCALCGLSVSMMWPGTLSYAVSRFPSGGTLLFGLLAVFGLLGCAIGPWFTGFIADNSDGGLRTGILASVIFPAIAVILVLLMRNNKSTTVS